MSVAGFVGVLAFLLQAQATNAELGYRFTLPSGFTPLPEGPSQQDVVGCWREAAPASTHGAGILCVQRLRGVLPRDPLRQQDVPATTRLVTFRWKDFDIQGLRSLASQNGQRVFVLVAQVPLRREAVQLIFSGPADREADGQALMQSALSTLEGDTNWLTGSERAERLGKAVGWWIGVAVALAGVLVWRKRRRAAKA